MIPPAHREIAGPFDLVEPVVAVVGQPDDELLGFDLIAGGDRADGVFQLIARRQRLHDRLDRRDEHLSPREPAGRELRDDAQSVARGLFADLPERSRDLNRRQRQRTIAEEQLKVVCEIVDFIEVPADEQDRTVRLPRHRRHRRRDSASPQPADGDGMGRFKRGRKRTQLSRGQ